MFVAGLCIGAIVGGIAAFVFADRVITEIIDRPRNGHCRARTHCPGCDAKCFAKDQGPRP